MDATGKGKGKGAAGRARSAIFEEVLASELGYLRPHAVNKPQTHAEPADRPPACDADYAAEIVKYAHDYKLSGIAFSGGGIRSATFNLGVLQALAKLRLLDQFDYLSTVSGGGYIGSWLQAWISRERKQTGAERSSKAAPAQGAPGAQETLSPFERVSNALAASAGDGGPRSARGAMQPDPPPISHLREYSNYLTPRRGLWSTDTWTLGAAYIRNLLLTLSVFIGAVVATVFFAEAFVAYFNHTATGASTAASDGLWTRPYFVSLGLIALASAFLGYELSPRRTAAAKTAAVAVAAVITILVSAISVSVWLWSVRSLDLKFSAILYPAGVLAVVTIGVSIAGYVLAWFVTAGESTPNVAVSPDGDEPLWKTSGFWWSMLGAGLAVLAMVALWWRIAIWMADDGWTPATGHLVVWGPPIIALTYTVAITISVGFSSTDQPEVSREWLARFSGALAKWTSAYVILIALVVYSHQIPGAVAALLRDTVSDKTAGSILTGLWAVVSGAGAFLARQGGSAGRGQWLRGIVLAIAPLVFVLGFSILIVWAIDLATHALVSAYAANPGGGLSWLARFSFFEDLAEQTTMPGAGGFLMSDGYYVFAFVSGIVIAVVTAFWSYRIGVNDFSMHALYGNRLVRAYLGASVRKRQAHPFTGFCQQDNSERMADLIADRMQAQADDSPRAPYPIVNAAINLVSSRRLAWQKRKAASFVFTPKYCGYEFCDENPNDPKRNAAPTRRKGGYADSAGYGGDDGVSLGKAMTISGAAASPNMGYHSSPALAILMTLFNVRLGWWLPNTAERNTNTLKRPGPRLGLLYLFMEAMGLTSARRKYVYLSDGGHFENLGIYELVRRRCRLIIASDAEADPGLTFGGLGNAIEKCRTDLGVPITIDVTQIKRDVSDGKSRWHCAIGCIRYSEADPGHHDGALLYIKAALTGDEPQDVATYAQAHPSFPHETTADQWFDESQFESYRALGEHTALRVLSNAVEIAKHDQRERQHYLERIFLELRKQWYPHSEPANLQPADHDRLLQQLLERLRGDSNLGFLDSQLYPNLQRVADDQWWPPKTPMSSGGPAGDSDTQKTHPAGLRPGAPRPPANRDELRAGFYFCKELIQFMQTVFHDRRLDTEYAAPSNRGWMNLFRRWALSRMFRFTWAATAGTYSARLQSFCEFHLSLDSGEAHVDENHTKDLTAAQTEQWVEDEDDTGLHRYERCIIDEFIRAYVRDEAVKALEADAIFTVYPLRLEIDSVFETTDGKPTLLNAGFFVVGPSPRSSAASGRAVLFFRIRSSMRNMDLARRAFIEIRKPPYNQQVCLVHELPEIPPRDDSDSVRRRAYREVHRLERENLERCRWFAQLLEETAGGGGQPPGEGDTAQRGDEPTARA